MADTKKMPYLPGLDGLRAIAVVAVLLYHSGGGWLPGGYLGVEVFFVLSGYLITSLLIIEWRNTGRINLKAFWMRRARRLLPELFAMLLVVLVFALLFLHDEVAGLRDDALAAAAYITNWRLIFSHQSYFESLGRPSLLRHLWSLAVEEQFYLLWPPIFALAIAALRPRGVMLVAVLGAVASTIAMALLFHPGADVSRVYYGTDTRAAGVLIGAALAFVWAPWSGVVSANPHRRLAVEGTGILALLAVVLFFLKLTESGVFLFRGGFAVVGLTTSLLIAAIVHPQSITLNAILGSRVMRWLGTRSYGIYLWHWPIYMVTRPQQDIALDGVPLFALRLAITLSVSELSYRFVQGSVRNGAIWRRLRALRNPRALESWPSRVASVSGALGAAVFVFFLVSAHAPATPDYLQVGSFHGVVQAREPDAGAPATVSASTMIPALPGIAASATADPPTEEAAGAAAPPSPAVQPPAPASLPPIRQVTNADILAIGDSVMVGAATYLGQVGTIEIDAEEGRQPTAVVSILEAREAAGSVPWSVVIHTGNNGVFTRGEFDEIVGALGPNHQIVFINNRVGRPWENSNNAMMAAAAGAYGNVRVVDWYAASAGHPEYFWSDGIHLRPEGANLYARLIAAAITPPPPPPTPTPIPTATPTPSPAATATPAATPNVTPPPAPGSSPTPTSTAVSSATPVGTSTARPKTATSPTRTPGQEPTTSATISGFSATATRAPSATPSFLQPTTTAAPASAD